MFIQSRQWPLKKIGGKLYQRGITYPSVEDAKRAINKGDRRIKQTLYHPID